MQSIGERLEEARKRKGISIREAAEATKIRSDYLHKFESNQFDIKLPEIYVRGFLRTYANFLKLPAEKIVSDYNALGLSDAKPSRSLGREVYGRMDLSVASAKNEPKEPQPAPPPPAAAEPAGEPAARNPATFVPHGTPRAPLDRALLMKLGAAVGAVVLLTLVVVWAFSGRGEDRRAANNAAAQPSTDIAWVRPQGNEPTLGLYATNGPVTVSVVTRSDNVTLYQGTIPRGESRAVPRRGAVRVTSDPFQNLEIEIAGTRHKMPYRAGDIGAP